MVGQEETAALLRLPKDVLLLLIKKLQVTDQLHCRQACRLLHDLIDQHIIIISKPITPLQYSLNAPFTDHFAIRSGVPVFADNLGHDGVSVYIALRKKRFKKPHHEAAIISRNQQKILRTFKLDCYSYYGVLPNQQLVCVSDNRCDWITQQGKIVRTVEDKFPEVFSHAMLNNDRLLLMTRAGNVIIIPSSNEENKIFFDVIIEQDWRLVSISATVAGNLLLALTNGVDVKERHICLQSYAITRERVIEKLSSNVKRQSLDALKWHKNGSMVLFYTDLFRRDLTIHREGGAYIFHPSTDIRDWKRTYFFSDGNVAFSAKKQFHVRSFCLLKM